MSPWGLTCQKGSFFWVSLTSKVSVRIEILHVDDKLKLSIIELKMNWIRIEQLYDRSFMKLTRPFSVLAKFIFPLTIAFFTSLLRTSVVLKHDFPWYEGLQSIHCAVQVKLENKQHNIHYTMQSKCKLITYYIYMETVCVRRKNINIL